MQRGRHGRGRVRGSLEKIMVGVTVCSTGLTSMEKDDLKDKVTAMGGSFHGNLTVDTTHLAAACSDTEKYRVATTMKDVVVVRPSWVSDSCQQGRKLPCEEYAIPPFEGLRITVTGLPIDRKERLREMIESGGGGYMGAMEMNATTHLVAEAATGAKYEAATSPEWRGTVKIVRSQWVEECFARRLRLPEETFPVSTGEDDHTEDDCDEDHEGEERYHESKEEKVVAAQADRTGEHPGRRQRHSSSRNIGSVEATTPSTASSAANASRGGSLYPWGSTGTKADDGETAGDGKVEGVPTRKEALALPDGDYLSGCRLMLIGFAAEALLPLSLLVRKGCGVRYASPNEEITHVIVGDRSLANPKLVSALEAHPCSPALVTALWLQESCRAGRMLATEGYLCPRPSDGGRFGTRGRSGDGGGGDEDRGGGGGGGGAVRRFGVGPNRSLGGTIAAHAGHPGDPPTKSKANGDGDGGGGNGKMKDAGSNVSGGENAAGSGHRRREVGHHIEAQEGHAVGGGMVRVSMTSKPAGWAEVAKKELERGRFIAHARMGKSRPKLEAPGSTNVDDGGCRDGGSVRESSNKHQRAAEDRDFAGCRGGNDSSRRRKWQFFRKHVFVVHGTGLTDEEEQRAAGLVVKYGGRCLDPDDTRSAPALRRTLLSAGVELTAASAVTDRKLESDELAAETRASRADLPDTARCFVVGKHGSCPLVSTWRDDGGGGIEDSRSGDLRACEGSQSLSTSQGKPGDGGGADRLAPDKSGIERERRDASDVRARQADGETYGVKSMSLPETRGSQQLSADARPILESEARAEIVTLFWLEACNRLGDFRQPRKCEEVFRPQPWPITPFPEVHEGPTEGRVNGARAGPGSVGVWASRRFAVAVTGFVGAERTGWEQLIECMGAEMCKSLKKRGTTHLVCKEAKGDKYKTALKWGVHVVTADWLLRCARQGYQAGSESLYHPERIVERPPVEQKVIAAVATVTSEEMVSKAVAAKSAALPLTLEVYTSTVGTSSPDEDHTWPAGGAGGMGAQQAARSEVEAGGDRRTEHSSVLRGVANVVPWTTSRPVHGSSAASTMGGAFSDVTSSQRGVATEMTEALEPVGVEGRREDLADGQGISAAVTPEAPAAAVKDDLAPATSDLERQLRSMLSAADVGGNGVATNAITTSATAGLEVPAHRRRLRLNAWGLRPSTLSAGSAVLVRAGEGGVSSRLKAMASTTARETGLDPMPAGTSGQSPTRQMRGGEADEDNKQAVESAKDGAGASKGLQDGGGRKRPANFDKTFVARGRRRAIGGHERSGGALSSLSNERRYSDGHLNWPPRAGGGSVLTERLPREGQENDPQLSHALLQTSMRAETVFGRTRHDGQAPCVMGNNRGFWDGRGPPTEQQHLEEESQIVTYE